MMYCIMAHFGKNLGRENCALEVELQQISVRSTAQQCAAEE